MEISKLTTAYAGVKKKRLGDFRTALNMRENIVWIFGSMR